MNVTINEHSVLALYTLPGESTTRSVLLCRVAGANGDVKPVVAKIEETAPPQQLLFEPLDDIDADDERGENLAPPATEEYVMIDHLPLTLAVTVPQAVDGDALCRFMIASYCFVHYSAEKTEEAIKQYSACDDERAVVPLLRDIDATNESDYDAYWQSMRRARYDDTEELQGGPNVRFIRACRQFRAVGRDFAGETQYRLTLDNHRILMYFVRRFRRPIKCTGIEYRVRLMSPMLNHHALWQSQCPEHYVEAQLNARENPDFVQSLRFERHWAVQDGLLSPGLFPINYGAALRENEARHALEVARQDLPHNSTHYVSQLGYNHFFVPLAQESPRGALVLYGCDYRERHDLLGYVAPSAVGPVKRKKAATKEATVRAHKRKADNQSTLDTFFGAKAVKLNQ